jgi:hypothetical protein
LQSVMSYLGLMVTYFWWPFLYIHLYSETHVSPKYTQTIIYTAILTMLNVPNQSNFTGKYLVVGSWRGLGLCDNSGKNCVSPKVCVWVLPLLTKCMYSCTAYLAGAQFLFMYSMTVVLMVLCLELTV